MKKKHIAIIVLTLVTLISGCDRLRSAKELSSKVDELSNKLENAEKTAEQLRNENEKLKESLAASTDKDKKNLNRLFR